MKIGYARVSTKHQRESLDQQIDLLKKAGCKEIYSEIILEHIVHAHYERMLHIV